ncbi:hypothetical protein G9A89_019959 [Geosiphon pyriformis]|nr:hypothetical protein G9A89_019959 [Geosiphon pyriformis]
MMVAAKMTNDYGVVINTNLKCPGNNRTNRAIVLKEIPVGTSVEAVHAVVSEFGKIKMIKMQLISLWQKVIVKLEDQTQADLLASKWSILIGKNAVHVARADIDKQLWDARDSFRALLHTLPVRTTTHDFSEWQKGCPFSSGPAQAGEDLRKEICSHPLAFSSKTWASVVGASPTPPSSGSKSQFGSIINGEPLPPIVDELEKRLVSIKSSLVSLVRQIGELAKRLDSLMLIVSQPSPGCQLLVTPPPPSQNPESDIVMGVTSGETTNDETTAIVDSSVSPQVTSELVWKVITYNVRGMTNSAKQDDIIHWHNDMNNLISIFTETKLKGRVRPWIVNKFNGIRVFTSGLDSGYLGAGVMIIVNSSLARHVCKISKLLFKNKLSVSILGLYAGASSVVWFSQTGEVNSFITKAVNKSSFVILGGDFNENGLYKSASFKKCLNLGLVNSLSGSSVAKSPTWENSRGVKKTIDYVFVFSSLVSAIIHRDVLEVGEHYNMDHQAVFVSIGLGGLLDMQLNSLRKQANKDHWKFNFKSADRIVKASHKKCVANFESLMRHWVSLDDVRTSVVQSLVDSGAGTDDVHSALFGARRSYHAFKLAESLRAKKANIRSVIDKRMENFEVDKGHTIRSVLEQPFHKVVLDHLVMGDELILEPDLAFSGVICVIDFDELHYVVSNLPDGKAAGLLVSFGFASGSKGVLTNTHLIALIKTACKILSKILSNKISLACSSHDVLHGNNFSVLKSTATQSPIFAIGLVVENVLEKNQKLWLLLQNMRKTYNLVGWEHLEKSLVRIKMCSKFIQFFGSIYKNCTNRVMTNFSLTDGYHVHDGLDQGEVFSPLLWRIFYDSLLCEVKRQGSVYGYRLNSHFAGLSSFFAAGAFTVAIPINSRVSNLFLSISGSLISIAKKGESHWYLGIFLSTEGLLKPSLAKANSDCQSESKIALLISFANSIEILGHMFSHKSHDLQVLCWQPIHPLISPTRIRVSVSNNFLAGVVSILLDCKLSLGGSLASAFWFCGGVLMSVVLGESLFFKFLPSLRRYGVAFVDQLRDRHVGVGPVNICGSDDLCLSLKNLGTTGCKAGAAAFFEDINLGLGISVQDLMLSILAELQTIALALEYVPVAHSVCLFSDSQTVLDAYMSECRHIRNVIRTDSIADAVTFYNWFLSSCVDKCFLLADNSIVSGNSRHFARDIFHAVCQAHWEVSSSSEFLPKDLHLDVDWPSFSRVWHSDLHMATGFTNRRTADCIYDRCYLSVLCLYCGEVEVSDHVFSCIIDDLAHRQVLESCMSSWKAISGLSISSSNVLQLLSTCASDFLVSLALYKGFVFRGWFREAVSIFHDPKITDVKITDFVCFFCVTFRNNIWLVRAKHCAYMEKNDLIPVDGSIPVSVSGLVSRFSDGVIKLLGIAKAFGVRFGFHKSCSFFSGIGDSVSVNIDV